jgi:M6 family metalloprotease-like protein
LNITADIYGYYRASKPSSYYEEEYEKAYAWDDELNDFLYSDDEITYPDSDLIYELLTYYNNQINYQDYDANNDGYIDGIYILYTAPVSFSYGSDLWWAYQDLYAYYDDVFDQVEPNYFCWSGTDFLLEGDDGINARTIIHETGHMLGLEDYYDYDTEDSYNQGGLGGADMMDNTVGDHNPFSKLLLGWIHPYVVTESMQLNLTPFIGSGDTILLINKWNNTLFDEYLLISFYTPTELNYLDRYEIFSINGIVIYHIDAKIGNSDSNSSYPSYFFTNNNTDSPRKLISIIEADQDNDIVKNSNAENSDLFQAGSVFKGSIQSNYDWYNQTIDMNFTVSITSIQTDIASINIDFK